MRKLINKFYKEYLYFHYLSTVGYDSAKEYDSITKGKMVDAIRAAYLANNDLITETLDTELLKQLINLNNKNEDDLNTYLKDRFIEIELSSKLLFAFDNVNDQYQIHDDFKEIISNLTITDEIVEKEYFTYSALGMVLTYGAITFDSINEIYASNQEKDNQFKFDIRDFKYFLDVLHWDDYLIYTDAIVHPIYQKEELPLIKHEVIHSNSYYYSLGKYMVLEKYIDAYLNAEYKYEFSDSFDYFLMMQDSEKVELSANYIQSLMDNYDENTLFIDLFYDWPLWANGGLSISESESNDKSTVVDYKLPFEMGLDYGDYFNNFLYFANQTVKVVKQYSSFEEFMHNTDEKQFSMIMNKSVKNRKIIKKFQNGIDKSISKYISEFNTGLNNALVLKHAYFIGLDDKGMAMIYAKDKIYHVAGLSRGMSKLFNDGDIELCDITIIPLNDYLCYFFFINKYSIDFTNNVKSVIIEELDKAEHIYSIKDILKRRLN